MKYAIENKVEIIWFILGINGYGFDKDKNLYNLKSGRKLKQSYNNRCLGYWISKNFFSLKKIKPLLYKPKNELLPF